MDRTDALVERAARKAKAPLAREIRARARQFKTVAAMHSQLRPEFEDELIVDYLVALAELFLAPALKRRR